MCSSSSPQYRIALANRQHESRWEKQHVALCHQNRGVPWACKNASHDMVCCYMLGLKQIKPTHLLVYLAGIGVAEFAFSNVFQG
jgi:hypothetical protein